MRLAAIFAIPVLALAASDGSSTASARGGFNIPPDEPGGEVGVAAFNFALASDGSKPGTGTLNYSAEDHAHDHARKSAYPHVVIRMKQFTELSFTKKAVYGRGIGQFHDENAEIEFRAEDRSPAPDFFHIEVRHEGHVLYHRHGELNVGEIKVNVQ